MTQDTIKILRVCPYTLITSLDLHGRARILYDVIAHRRTTNDLCTRPIFGRVQRSFFEVTCAICHACMVVHSLVPRPHPPGEEASGYNTTSRSTQSLSRLVCGMTNHCTVRVISSAVRSHVALIIHHIWHM